MLSPTLLRLDANNQTIGDLGLAHSFFNPTQISDPGIEPYLRGLAKQVDRKSIAILWTGSAISFSAPPAPEASISRP